MTAPEADASIPAAPREADGFRADIEGLRGVAVLLVVLFHAGMLSGAGVQIPGGFIGVDLFFVVSGFLITGLLIRERERTGSVGFARFYARRVRRILPAAAVVLLITIPLSYVLITLIQRPATMTDGAAASLSIANIRFALTTDYFNPVNYSPFLHFWSLGVEEQFYFVWPALLAAVAWKAPRLGVGIALAAIVAGSFVASLIVTDANPSMAFYMLPTRAWQLAAGGLLAVGAGTFERLPQATRSALGRLLAFAGWAALSALITAALVIDSVTTAYPGMAAIVPTIAGVLLIASGQEAFGPGVLLRLAPIRFLGKISYSLYLWHWPVLILGGLWLNGPLGASISTDGSVQLLAPAQAVVLALVAVPIAAASWAFVEEPFRHGRVRMPRPSRLVLAGATVMVAVAVAGTGLGFAAESSLADLSGPADTLAPSGPTPTPTVSLAVSPPAGDSAVPGYTPAITPLPGMTPALTPAPPWLPDSHAVAGLRPALGRAPADYEQTWKDNCLANLTDATLYPVGSCVFGDPNGTYRVALIGDSHASALFPAVNEVAKAHGWRLDTYLKKDCPFVDIAVENTLLKREYTECATWNTRLIARLAANPPDLAILNMNRFMHTYGAGAPAQGKSMAREMEKLPSQTRVVLVADIPYPWNENVPDCLSAHMSDYRKCAYPRDIGLRFYQGQRETIAAKEANAGLIDPAEWICPGSDPCPAVMNGMIMFRDTHHLTATYAASLGPALDESLTALLAKE